MGRARDGLCCVETGKDSKCRRVDCLLPAISGQLQDSTPRRVFRYRTTEERLRQNTEEGFARTLLDSSRARCGLTNTCTYYEKTSSYSRYCWQSAVRIIQSRGVAGCNRTCAGRRDSRNFP